MRRFGLLGERLSHSFSPMIHGELGSYEYNLYEKKPEELEHFLMHGNFDGLNVTIPYKTTVIPFCADLSKNARSTGSVNTITRRIDGSLFGDTTDYFGFAYLLKKTGVNLSGGKILILGSGGSSLTVQIVLKDMGIKEVVVISRSGADNYENIENHRDAILIINTTPVGMYPNNSISPLADFDIFQKCRAVIDLIYNPARTELLMQAEERGILAVNGLSMLVAQAKKAAEQFLGSSIPDAHIEKITLKILKTTQNIVLIGMPGCGKSSIGSALAKKLNREFADTDELITETVGKNIPAIFADDGEAEFRKLETAALRMLCKRSGLIIATGGGIVKRQENRNIIRQNGIVIFLDRDIGDLPVSGRPISERDGITTLAAERLPIYSQWGDYTVSVRGVEQTANDINNIYEQHQK